MELEKKKKSKLFNKIVSKIFLVLFVSFFALYVSQATGYYEFEQHKHVELTQNKIQEFEKDVKNGKNIDISDYINEKEINYQNSFSNIGSGLSIQIGNIIQNGLETTFGFLEKLFNSK